MNIFDAADGSTITLEDVHVRVSVTCENPADGNSARHDVCITSLQQPFTTTNIYGDDVARVLPNIRFTVVGVWEMQSLLHQFASLFKLEHRETTWN